MPATATAAEALNVINLFMNADWVIKGVIVGLALASLWSWAVIFDRAARFVTLNRQANAFEEALASGQSLEDLAQQAGPNPRQALPRMLVAAMRDWRDTRSGGALSDAQAGFLITRIDRTLDAIIAREGQSAEEGLGVLSVVATASPFIGLFGTVYGIMHAFGEIAAQGNTNLTTVAPAIAEALFATGIGLAAAIPAYIAYNKFSIDAGKFSGRMETFADDLQAAIARRLGERGTPPPAPTASLYPAQTRSETF